MSSRPHDLLRAALQRLSPAPPSDSDADLLRRYVATRDEVAFTAIVRRHGPMVLGVCRRRLGAGPDAEDAFQVTFLVLARDAARIDDGAALPGWLYRVAYLIALKQSGKLSRNPEALPDEPPTHSPSPDAVAAGRESLAILDEELNALPDKLRSVLVLCGLEERTNAEAAKMLGCPTGTIDSRLSAARQKLRARLARRGLAALSLPVVAEAVRADDVARAALAYAAAAGTLTDPLSTLADGVSPIMSTAKVKLLAAASMCLALFGTAGLGLIHATGPEPAKPKAEAKAKAEADPPKSAPTPEAVEADKSLKTEEEIRKQLAAPPAIKLQGEIAFATFLAQINGTHGVNARLDTASFQRLTTAVSEEGAIARLIKLLEEAMIRVPDVGGLSLADVLTDVIAQLPPKLSYRVRGNQILIGPAYHPPAIPGSGENLQAGETIVDTKLILEQIVGEPVSFAIEDRPLTDAVKELRKLTGANIVIDARCKDKAKQAVSGSFSDVRLLTALSVLADMCDLKPVAMNNVYYVTTPENAAKLQKQVNADLFGAPPTAVPAGYVTDGIHLYEKPANLKPAELGGLGGGGGGSGPGVVPAPPPEKK